MNVTSPELDLTLVALADPTRRAILRHLAGGDARVTDLAEPFPISLNSVSKHIRALERAGLVTRRRHGREHILTLQPARARPGGGVDREPALGVGRATERHGSRASRRRRLCGGPPMTTEAPTVTVTHTFEACPRACLRRLDSTRTSIRAWMGSFPNDEVVSITVDGRVGGRFSFLIRREGQLLDHAGEYLEFDSAGPARVHLGRERGRQRDRAACRCCSRRSARD